MRSESTIRTMTEATTEAEKHASLCEALAAHLAEVRVVLEKARAKEAERARAAAAAEAAAAAGERVRMEQEVAEISLRVQTDMRRLQQLEAQLGSSSSAVSVCRGDVERMLREYLQS